eukprot:TRINITY_DN2054_c0_g1_i1.p1 TRINITY_DN2054_c0_g1~~TRINITY_DN2054_c0_g1_i1.p1  ORF type:complete len:723 (-),score=222.80 TRINITY_DN2054_c0_g1_i1:67-2235(-)
MSGRARKSRSIRTLRIEADSDSLGINVWYEVHSAGTKKKRKRRVAIDNTEQLNNVSWLAQKLFQEHAFIDAGHQGELLGALQDLQHRYFVTAAAEEEEEMIRAFDMDEMMMYEQEQEMVEMEERKAEEAVRIMEENLELMYSEDVDEKIKGARFFVGLSKSQQNLQFIVENERLMNLLSRELKQEAQKNLDYMLALLAIFFTLSRYSQMHEIISSKGVVWSVLKTVLGEKKRSSEVSKRITKLEETYKRMDDPVKKRLFGEKLQDVKEELRNEEDKHSAVLYFSVTILLNVSEQEKVEKNLSEMGIAKALVHFLDRDNVPLLVSVLTFLKKLSIVGENKDKMVKVNIIEKLDALFRSKAASDEILIGMMLRLLANLAFDPSLRQKMIAIGMVPRVVKLLHGTTKLRPVCRLLYHFSLDNSKETMASLREAIPTIMRIILFDPSEDNREIVALAANLAASSDNAELMVVDGQLGDMLRMAVTNKDPVLLRVTLHISSHPNCRMLFAEHVDLLFRAATDISAPPEYIGDALGLIGNLSEIGKEIRFASILKKYGFVGFLNDILENPDESDEILQQTVVIVGTLMNDPECVPLVEKSNIVSSIGRILLDHRDDDELLPHLVYALLHFVVHDSMRPRVLANPLVIEVLVEMLREENPGLRQIVDGILDYLMEIDARVGDAIRKRKFETYNAVWVQRVDEEEQGGAAPSFLDPMAAGYDIPADYDDF